MGKNQPSSAAITVEQELVFSLAWRKVKLHAELSGAEGNTLGESSHPGLFPFGPAHLQAVPRLHSPRLAHTHHGGQAGDVLDRILHLLLRHLHQGAILILGGQQLRSVLGDPRVQLQLITQPVRDDCLFFVTPTTTGLANASPRPSYGACTLPKCEGAWERRGVPARRRAAPQHRVPVGFTENLSPLVSYRGDFLQTAHRNSSDGEPHRAPGSDQN